jgi:hypothetical protein
MESRARYRHGDLADARLAGSVQCCPRKARVSQVKGRDTHMNSRGAGTSPQSSETQLPGFTTQLKMVEVSVHATRVAWPFGATIPNSSTPYSRDTRSRRPQDFIPWHQIFRSLRGAQYRAGQDSTWDRRRLRHPVPQHLKRDLQLGKRCHPVTCPGLPAPTKCIYACGVHSHGGCAAGIYLRRFRDVMCTRHAPSGRKRQVEGSGENLTREGRGLRNCDFLRRVVFCSSCAVLLRESTNFMYSSGVSSNITFLIV